jgi:hypothetical protein
METKKYILLIMFSFSQFVFCQNNNEDKDGKAYNSLTDLSKDFRYHLVAQIANPNINSSSEMNLRQNNSLNINQIGDYNTVAVNLKAQLVDLDILQYGDENTFQIDSQGFNFKQRVVQQGQNNTIKDVSRYNNRGIDVNMEFIQKGNNQNIQNYGTNSMSKDMKVIQKGNGASVLIINHR